MRILIESSLNCHKLDSSVTNNRVRIPAKIRIHLFAGGIYPLQFQGVFTHCAEFFAFAPPQHNFVVAPQ